MKILTAISLAAMSVTGCGTAQQPSQASLTDEAYLFKSNSGESVEALRGSFKVKENRSDPNSRDITLQYVKFPTTNPNPGSPIVYLAGGPGGSGVGTARRQRYPLFLALREVADVIAFDQRGTGWSSDLPACNTDKSYPLDEPLDEAKAIALYKDAAKECVAFWAEKNVDLAAYNTLESARDLEDLRNHLGADKINLWSISYGTHLAMAAVKVMDAKIDRIVMTGGEGLHQTVKLPARTDAFFGRVQEAINKDETAKAIYPDIDAMMRRVYAKLESNPVTSEFALDNGDTVSLTFGKTDLQMMTSFAIADPANTARILSLFLAIDNGQADMAAPLIYRFLRSGTIDFRPMSTAMDVASGISAARLAQVMVQAETSLVGSYLNFPMPHLKDAFGDLDLGDDFRSMPQSSTPTLLLSGTLDGRTYPESQLEAVAGFSDVTQVIVENAGHNLFMSSPEVGERIADFLSGEDADPSPIVLPLPDFKPQR